MEMVNKMEETNITISKYDYDQLKETNIKYNLLMKVIFDSVDLDLFDDLRFDSEELQKAIKVLEPNSYQCKQTELTNLKKLEEENGVSNNESN